MTISENDKLYKTQTRKELRGALQDTLGELMTPNQDFNLMVKQLNQLDLIRGNIGHLTRSNLEKNILKNSEHYPPIIEMMRSGEDKKLIAKAIKKALKEEGYENDDITELRDKALIYNPTYQMFDISKTETEKVLLKMLMKYPIWTKYLLEVTGISVLTGSKLMHYIGDITRFSQPSKLIKYCGLAVDEEGKAQRMKAGVAGNYKPDLKSLLLGVIGDNFIRSNSQYRRIYDERKSYMMDNRPEWGIHPSGKDKLYMSHYHKDATRYMMKRFIHEYWDNGWLLSGVQPPSKPYAVSFLGHDMEPKVVPVNSDAGLIYSWNESGVLGKDRRILYSWKEWQDYVDSLNQPIE